MIECRFTEPGGGKCSQPAASHLGKPQCNGSYVEQHNPTSGVRFRCALAGKGIRYWEHIYKVFALDAATDYAPCPFAGEACQWMRNAVLAAAIASTGKLQAAAIAAFADHPSLPTARKANRGPIDLTLGGEAAIMPISYQEIINIALRVGLGSAALDRFLCMGGPKDSDDMRCFWIGLVALSSLRQRADARTQIGCGTGSEPVSTLRAEAFAPQFVTACCTFSFPEQALFENIWARPIIRDDEPHLGSLSYRHTEGRCGLLTAAPGQSLCLAARQQPSWRG